MGGARDGGELERWPNGREGSVSRNHVGGMVGRRVPIKVAIIDVERCPAEISAVHPDGGRYVALWVLARLGGEPRALIKLPFDEDVISSVELAAHFSGPAFAPRPGWLGELVDPPLISVVVPTTFGREQELRGCLASLAALDYPRFEVLVVNNSASDLVPAWVEDYPHVTVLRERRLGVSAARNCGIRHAAGEIVAFTDDDVVVDPAWLTAFARRLAAHPEEAAVGGLMFPRELETGAQLSYEEYYGVFTPRMMQPLTHRLARPVSRVPFRRATIVEVTDAGDVVDSFSLYSPGGLGPGQSGAFRTDVLRAVGGFEERLGVVAGEDVLLWARLAWRGYPIGFEPAALVSHTHRRDDQELRRQVSAYGVGFTATLLALVLEDPRHLGAILATAPRALPVLGRQFWTRLRSTQAPPEGSSAPASSVADLARLELLGMLRGPAVYVQSSLAARRRGSSGRD